MEIFIYINCILSGSFDVTEIDDGNFQQNLVAFHVKAIETKPKQNKAHTRKHATNKSLSALKTKKPTDIDIILGNSKAGCWSLLRILLIRVCVCEIVDWFALIFVAL